MGSLSQFLHHVDWFGMLLMAMGVVASLLCITVHEVSHGLAAYRLGDPTAKLNGRLTLNPISHIDPVGLLMMITVRVGWAKPVPVDSRNFRNPKRDMAVTALAGPASNFLLALLALFVASACYHFLPEGQVQAYAVLFFCYLAVLSTGLGTFNLIPLPPLDGSKILFSLLPERIYWTILRYERFLILAVVVLAWLGFFSGPLSQVMAWLLEGMCRVTGLPFGLLAYYFF